VRYLLTGSVRRFEQQIRVITRLIDTADGSQIWSRDMTRNEHDVFLIRDDIARMVSHGLGLQNAAMQFPAQTIDTAGLSARDLYWTGRLYFRQRTDKGVRASLDYFRQAIAGDPSFALGYCGLADALFVVAERALLPPDGAMAEASNAAHKAVQLDGRLPEAWVSLAQVTSIYYHNLEEAERLFRHALEMDPKSSAAWQWYSYQLVKQRRFPESIHAAEAAVAADPLSLPANINLAVVLLYSGVDDRALQQCRKLSQMDPQLSMEHTMVAIVFARKGLGSEALHEMESVPEPYKNHRITLRVWVEVYAMVGMREQAGQALERLIAQYRLGGIPVSYVAAGYAAVGDKDRAIEWLGRALAARDAFASVANAYPAFDSIRLDPRYAPLMAQLGIKVQTASGSFGHH
jgi:serine/threonine-protein kinase